jgi:hypothetical protein
VSVWIGDYGMLAELPDPDPGVGIAWDRPHAAHRLLGGGRVVDHVGAGRRTLALTWSGLDPGLAGQIEAYATGSAGRGPHLLLPADAPWNYLTADQASTGTIIGDTTGWSTTLAGSLFRYPRWPNARASGPQILGWYAPLLGGELSPNPPAGEPGWPAVPGVAWTFAAALMGDAGAIVAGLLRWRDKTGADLGTTVGTSVRLTWDGWQPVTVTATPPADAVSVLVSLRADSAAASVQIADPRLDLTAAPRPFIPGRGLPRVVITGLEPVHTWVDTVDLRATFTEVT